MATKPPLQGLQGCIQTSYRFKNLTTPGKGPSILSATIFEEGNVCNQNSLGICVANQNAFKKLPKILAGKAGFQNTLKPIFLSFIFRGQGTSRPWSVAPSWSKWACHASTRYSAVKLWDLNEEGATISFSQLMWCGEQRIAAAHTILHRRTYLVNPSTVHRSNHLGIQRVYFQGRTVIQDSNRHLRPFIEFHLQAPGCKSGRIPCYQLTRMRFHWVFQLILYLVGGGNPPFEKNTRVKLDHFPQVEVKIGEKNMKLPHSFDQFQVATFFWGKHTTWMSQEVSI